VIYCTGQQPPTGTREHGKREEEMKRREATRVYVMWGEQTGGERGNWLGKGRVRTDRGRGWQWGSSSICISNRLSVCWHTWLSDLMSRRRGRCSLRELAALLSGDTKMVEPAGGALLWIPTATFYHVENSRSKCRTKFDTVPAWTLLRQHEKKCPLPLGPLSLSSLYCAYVGLSCQV